MAYRQQRFLMVAPFFQIIFFVWESRVSQSSGKVGIKRHILSFLIAYFCNLFPVNSVFFFLFIHVQELFFCIHAEIPLNSPAIMERQRRCPGCLLAAAELASTIEPF